MAVSESLEAHRFTSLRELVKFLKECKWPENTYVCEEPKSNKLLLSLRAVDEIHQCDGNYVLRSTTLDNGEEVIRFMNAHDEGYVEKMVCYVPKEGISDPQTHMSLWVYAGSTGFGVSVEYWLNVVSYQIWSEDDRMVRSI